MESREGGREHEMKEKNSPCEFISGPFVQSSSYYNRGVEVQETSDLNAALRLLKAAGMRKVGGSWQYKGKPVKDLKTTNTMRRK